LKLNIKFYNIMVSNILESIVQIRNLCFISILFCSFLLLKKNEI
jgi:hypothetical protein